MAQATYVPTAPAAAKLNGATTSSQAPPGTTAPAAMGASATNSTPTPSDVSRHSLDDHNRGRPSRPSLEASDASSLHKEYLDSLVVPSNEEIARIAGIQEGREAEQRRRSRQRRQQQRRSLDATSRSPAGRVDNIVRGQKDGTSEAAPKTASPPPSRSHSLSRRLGLTRLDDAARAKAAIVIQRHYRGYRTRREMKGLGISARTRWIHAIREAQYRELTRPRPRSEARPATGIAESEPASIDTTQADSVLDRPMSGHGVTGESNARRNWKKAAGILKRANLDNDSDSELDDDDDDGGDNDDTDEHDASAELSSDSASCADLDDIRRKPKSTSRNPMSEEKQRQRQQREAARAQRSRDARIMGLQYFLEMIDHKHRYGSNLRTYHEAWKRADTQEPFFYWLDYGEGRLLDLAACPRERLGREQVRYLSREERLNYLVKVDSQGRLCWAKNGVPIDTTTQWKDSIKGIVPIDDPTPPYQPPLTDEDEDEDEDAVHQADAELQDGMSTTGKSSVEDNDHRHNGDRNNEADTADAAKTERHRRRLPHIPHPHFYSKTELKNALERKAIRKNTWIFVADTHFRLYVGLKDAGRFQHSSFLQGARISAAGLLTVREGYLTSLAPLSGHYRPPTANFRAFVQSLRTAGVDMSEVSISKSYAMLVGLEAYKKVQQQGKRLLRGLSLQHHKDKALLKKKQISLSQEAALLQDTGHPRDSHDKITAPLREKVSDMASLRRIKEDDKEEDALLSKKNEKEKDEAKKEEADADGNANGIDGGSTAGHLLHKLSILGHHGGGAEAEKGKEKV